LLRGETLSDRDSIVQWLDRKLVRGPAQLRGVFTVSYEYNRVVGPRSIYAKVVLCAGPAESFSFKSEVRWPAENLDDWVVDGILDALFCVQHRPLLGAEFRLTEVGYHPVHSAPIAYYWAAKNAVLSHLSAREE
jgi:hypothetical protein